MLKYISVEFPGSDPSSVPGHTHSATLTHNRYEHEILRVAFWDWDVSYDSVEAGTPIKATLSDDSKKREFIGYVHHVEPHTRAGKNITTIVAVGASYLMKNAGQAVYKKLTADAIVKKIAAKYGFACRAVPHPRVYPQVAQAGRTDWELIVRLAKQCGYTVRTQGTELYFEPLLDDFKKYKSQALFFHKALASDFNTKTTIYDFVPSVGESIDYEDTMKSAIAVSGVEKTKVRYLKKVKKTPPRSTKGRARPHVFDRVHTSTVVIDDSTATFESESADLLAKTFPYRATVEVRGNVDARPNYPVYLEGIGSQYGGYWTILGVEHIIENSTDRQQTYICRLYIGTDSLGPVNPAFDNTNVASPAPTNLVTITPGVRQVGVSASSALVNTTPSLSPQISRPLKVSQNSPVISTLNAPVWKTTTPNLDTIVPVVNKSTTTSRLIARINE